MNASGFGRVASIIVVIDDDISKREIQLNLSVADAYAVDADGEDLGLLARIEATSVSTARENDLSLDLLLYPNPMGERGATLQLPQSHRGGSYQIIDLQGRTLKQAGIARSPVAGGDFAGRLAAGHVSVGGWMWGRNVPCRSWW